MEESLYVRLGGGRYLPTALTEGPWAPDRQHGGPVAALLAHAVESAAPPGWRIAGITVDFLNAVPLAEITVSTETVKDGRRIRCVSATVGAGGRVHAQAHAWQVAPGHVPDTGAARARAAAAGHAPAPVPKESSYGRASFQFGYQRAVEMRFVRGSFRARAPAAAWARLLVPLLPGAQPSAVQQVAAIADFGSGISAVLDRAAWSFVNLDLSVHLHRFPVSEWICLDAASLVGPEGTGVCQSTLYDETGPIGVAIQSLFVAAVTGTAVGRVTPGATGL